MDELKVEKIIGNLPHKKGSSVEINCDILKTSVLVIKIELADIINEAMSKNICPENINYNKYS